MSMEPCFHAPPFYDLKAKIGIYTGKHVAHVSMYCDGQRGKGIRQKGVGGGADGGVQQRVMEGDRRREVSRWETDRWRR